MINYYSKLRFFVLILLAFVAISCKKEANAVQPKTATDTVTKTRSSTNIDTSGKSAVLLPDTSKIVTPKDTTTKIIVVLGSSTAAGYGASKPDSAWVNRLKKRLELDGKKARILNYAIGGYTTYHVAPSGYSVPGGRPQADPGRNITMAVALHPSLIIINLPTNDIANGYSDDEIMNNYKAIAKVMDTEKIQYIITGTQPRNFPDNNQRKRMKTINDKMNLNYPGIAVDYLDKLSTSSWSIADAYNSGDGVHVNDKGHNIIFQSVLNAPKLRTIVGY